MEAIPRITRAQSMDALSSQATVSGYRAALIAEDTERREAGADLETRASRQWDDLVAGFEVRQIVAALEEGRSLSGQTAEIVSEMRAAFGPAQATGSGKPPTDAESTSAARRAQGEAGQA